MVNRGKRKVRRETMDTVPRGKFVSLTAILLIFVLFIGSMTISVQATEPTLVQVIPLNQSVSAGQTFTVNISCSPGQPIKSFEMKVSYNPSLLQVNSVTEGNIFHGYTTFFNNGIIDNGAGTIINIYDLIIGQYLVSAPGSFITISFTAKSQSGTSTIDLNDVGVTDDVGYLIINVSSGSTTIIGEETTPPGDGGTPGGGSSPPNEDMGEKSNENNPPNTPIKPIGPTFIERGVTYTYNSSASDPDHDQVRLRFDWGDGSVSNWTTFVDSNISISSSHAWSSISTYSISAIAQDKNGTNSSWSPILNVTVSQINDGNESPILDIKAPKNISTNQTILFNASESFDPDGVIVSYVWDFGDGTIGTGKTPVHIYKNPGLYTVILTITDNNGRTFSKTIDINVAAGSSAMTEDKQNFLWSNLNIIFIGTILAITTCLILIFRDKIKKFFRYEGIVDKRIKKLDKETTKLVDIIKQKSISERKFEVSKEVKKTAPSEISEESIEKKVDDILYSKMREKIDKL